MDLNSGMRDFPPGRIVMVETNAEKSLDVSLQTISILSKRKFHGIIICANRPASNLIELYEQAYINTKDMFFLDCVSKSQGLETEEHNNVIYLNNVSDLTSIALSLTECIKHIGGQRFLFIDTLTTMLIHNTPAVFARFIHSILTKLRVNNVSAVLISLSQETNREVRAEIAQLCDKVLQV